MAIDRSLLVRTSVGVAICATLGACGVDNQEQTRMQAAVDSVTRTDTVTAGGEVAGSGAASATAAPAMSDGNIVSAIGSTNAAEIAAGRAGERRAHDPQVKAFATMLVNDHRALQNRVDAAARAEKVTPQSSPGADSADRQVRARADSVDRLSGTAFDRAWVAQEIQDHQTALADLQRMQRTTQSQQLRALLGDAINGVETHLKTAQQLAARLGA